VTPKINSLIVLDKYQQKICEFIGKCRYNINREKNVNDKKVGDQDNHFVDVNGFGGEFAFCKLFNLMPDFTVKVTQTNKNDFDAILFNKIRVDIKTTQYSTGQLLVHKDKIAEVHCYALMVGSMPEYRFKGFMLKDEIIKPERLKAINPQKPDKISFLAKQEELKELYEIFTIKRNS